MIPPDCLASLEDYQRFDASKMQKNNVFDTDRFFLDVYCLEPGQEQKPHSHAGADKVYVVLEGEGEFLIGEGRQVVGPGHAVLAPTAVAHGVANRSDQRLVLLVFMSPNPNRK